MEKYFISDTPIPEAVRKLFLKREKAIMKFIEARKDMEDQSTIIECVTKEIVSEAERTGDDISTATSFNTPAKMRKRSSSAVRNSRQESDLLPHNQQTIHRSRSFGQFSHQYPATNQHHGFGHIPSTQPHSQFPSFDCCQNRPPCTGPVPTGHQQSTIGNQGFGQVGQGNVGMNQQTDQNPAHPNLSGPYQNY